MVEALLLIDVSMTSKFLCLLLQHKPTVSLLVSFFCVFCLRTNQTAVCYFFFFKKKWNDDYHLCSNISILFKAATSILFFIPQNTVIGKKKKKNKYFTANNTNFLNKAYIYINVIKSQSYTLDKSDNNTRSLKHLDQTWS